MTHDLTSEESELLARGLGSIGTGSTARGAGFAARRMRADIFETDITLALPIADAITFTRGILAELGTPVDEELAVDGNRLRAMVGAGGMNLNPTVVTVHLSEAGPSATIAQIRGVAKEGLIRQKAGRKAAERVADRLRNAGS
ncbi:hypothetical protein Adi01nite_34220 [Amorphoplanes digitatis]|uniref:hypothetical protein n=1 Tax=Actinoplanes digitatis TaxID=1868 RepID=UPI0019416DC1|nr:hypothetical protein [Actinoplanes digitatis]BFE74516.1 hypothetical protein GCM10020092_078170 [Actinoplanes digitatis]GID94010.1 hypothetical protein Adi01nite_34220 [Actinoplanes digitatis]